MNGLAYMKKDREKMFPQVKDWSSPQMKLRYKKRSISFKPKEYREWFWFSPSAYNLFIIGIPFTAASQFLIFSTISVIYGWFLPAVILGVFGLIFLYQGVKKALQYNQSKYTNMYDLFLRDSIKPKEVK